MRTAISGAMLLLMGGAARAEGTQADWDKLAQPEVKKFDSR